MLQTHSTFCKIFKKKDRLFNENIYIYRKHILKIICLRNFLKIKMVYSWKKLGNTGFESFLS